MDQTDSLASEPKRPAPGPMARRAYKAVGAAAVALAAAGVVLPGLPTTPFLLVALWAFSRGSPELAERLRSHPRYGRFIRDWEERRAIPTKAKAAAVIGCAVSWGILVWTSRSLLVSVGVGVILICVLAYVVTRPSR